MKRTDPGGSRGLDDYFTRDHQCNIGAEIIDTMHFAVAPVELGRGERLWNSHSELLDRFHLDSVPSPSGVTHLLFWHR